MMSEDQLTVETEKKAKRKLRPEDVQHVFHSGWQTESDGALGNTDQLRSQMELLGLHTDESQWSVFSDPREWQVLKEKFGVGGTPETAQVAGAMMLQNTLNRVPTVWHGHSQGGAQISTAGDLALQMLESDPERVEKARSIALGLQEANPEERARLLGTKGFDESGQRPMKNPFNGDDETQTLSEEEIQELLAKQIAREKAQKKLNKYNMFSYSGAAMYPPEFSENCSFSHNLGDPVSSGVVAGTPGPDWHEGEGREMQLLGGQGTWMQRHTQKDIGKHGYNDNYVGQDALNTYRLLERAGLLSEGAVDRETVPEQYPDGFVPKGPEVEPLPETTPGERIGDGLSTGPRWDGFKSGVSSTYQGVKSTLGSVGTMVGNTVSDVGSSVGGMMGTLWDYMSYLE